MTESGLPRLHKLRPIELVHWRSQIEHAPAGHLVVGPYTGRWFLWACASCGLRWSEGWHPAPASEAFGGGLAIPESEPEDSPWWEH